MKIGGDDAIEQLYVLIVAVGCTNLIPPEDAWIKREDDKIIIGCYTSRQTWQLRCHDGRWTGVVSNCSHAAYKGNYTGGTFIGNMPQLCCNNRRHSYPCYCYNFIRY